MSELARSNSVHTKTAYVSAYKITTSLTVVLYVITVCVLTLSLPWPTFTNTNTFLRSIIYFLLFMQYRHSQRDIVLVLIVIPIMILIITRFELIFHENAFCGCDGWPISGTHPFKGCISGYSVHFRLRGTFPARPASGRHRPHTYILYKSPLLCILLCIIA